MIKYIYIYAYRCSYHNIYIYLYYMLLLYVGMCYLSKNVRMADPHAQSDCSVSAVQISRIGSCTCCIWQSSQVPSQSQWSLQAI